MRNPVNPTSLFGLAAGAQLSLRLFLHICNQVLVAIVNSKLGGAHCLLGHFTTAP